MKTRNTFFLLALLFMGLVNIVVSYLAGHSSQIYIFNADQLYLPTLFNDLFSGHGHLADWFLTPAPYFFPDYPMFSLAYLLGPGTYSQVGLFAIIQTIATFAAIWHLCSKLLPSQGLLFSALATIGLIWLALMAGDPFSVLLASASHYGVFIIAILFVTLWLQVQDCHDRRLRALMLTILSVLGFLSTLSDNLFIVQLVAPLIATNVAIDLANRNFSIKQKMPLFIPIISSLLGAWAYSVLVTHDTRYPTHVGLEKLYDNLTVLYGIFSTTLTSTPAYGILFVVYLGIVVRLCCDMFKKPAHRQYPKPLAWLAVFSLLSLCCALSAVALITNLAVVGRYFIAGLSWPVIVVVVFTGHHLKQYVFAIAIPLALLAVISMSWATYTLVEHNGLNTRYYPSELACIDDALEREGATHGISQYWDSKYLQSFSRLNLTVAQHHENLEQMPWITSSKYFRDRYDFAIISEYIPLHTKLTPAPLLNLNGEPKKIVTCGAREVYFWGNASMRTQKLGLVGDTFKWKACELPTLVGQKNDHCEVEKIDPAQSGFLTFGPYEPLPTGRYELQVTYSSPDSSKLAVGHWDVQINVLNAAQVLAKGLINGSGSNNSTATGTFNVSPEQNLGRIELRTLSLQGSTLKIIQLKLTRVE